MKERERERNSVVIKYSNEEVYSWKSNAKLEEEN